MDKMKKYPTIGCCGIDCSLCPRYHTTGSSVCPGCGGVDFREKHPSCGFLTCCVIKKGFEVCSDCEAYPCRRFEAEKQGYDSFVSHKNVFSNLENIKENGIEKFVLQQKIRNDILTNFIANADDGRSKSFFCICCTLLPIAPLQDAQRYFSTIQGLADIKERNKYLKGYLQDLADGLSIDLKLNNKKPV